jgi:hypothetical protein
MRTVTLTLDRDHIGSLNDAMYMLLLDAEDADEEDAAGYRALRDEIQRQLNEQMDRTGEN